MVKSKAKPPAHKPPRKSEKDSTPKKAQARPTAKKTGSSASAPMSAAHPKLGEVAGNGHSHPPGVVPTEAHLAQVQQTIGSFKSASGVELAEKVKELLRLAQEQGYLTYNDINDALPDNI